MVYSWLKNTQFLLFPGRCVVCGEHSERPLDLCDACEHSLTRPWHRCQTCALPCASQTVHCGQCLQQVFNFTRCVALSPYRPPVNRLIGEFKYRAHLASGRVLAQLLGAQLSDEFQHGQPRPDYLVPVPLHWRRQWRRGFNQAHYLATTIGKQLDIAVADDTLVRRRHTTSQQGLNRRQRQHNLNRAFVIKRPPGSSHIALIDDVVTTGTTASQLAALLLQQGATQVDVWCLARTDVRATCQSAR